MNWRESTSDSPVTVEVEYETPGPWRKTPFANLHFYNDQGTRLFISGDFNDRSWLADPAAAGRGPRQASDPGPFPGRGANHRDLAAVSTLEPGPSTRSSAMRWLSRSSIKPGAMAREDRANDYPGVVGPILDWDVAQLSGRRGPRTASPAGPYSSGENVSADGKLTPCAPRR